MLNTIAKISIGSMAIAMVLSLSSVAQAGTETGSVTELHARGDGLIFFQLSGAHQNRPQCAQNFDYWMINENTEVGRRQYAMLLAAVQSGRSLSVDGANTCTRWPDGEDVYDLVITP